MSDPARPNRRQAARAKVGLKLAAALAKASTEMNRYLAACRDCEDGSGSKGADDGRLLLLEDMTEFRCWLESVYEAKEKA